MPQAATRPKPTFADLVATLDDGTTLYDIIFALNYVKKERARATAKNARNKQARSSGSIPAATEEPLTSAAS